MCVGSCPLAPWVLAWGVLALELQVSVIYWVCRGVVTVLRTLQVLESRSREVGGGQEGMAGTVPVSSLVFLGRCSVGVDEVIEW